MPSSATAMKTAPAVADRWLRPERLVVPAPRTRVSLLQDLLPPDLSARSTTLHVAVTACDAEVWQIETLEAGPGLELPPLPPPSAPSSPAETTPWTITLALPTGLGLETGGYAGDGTPAARLLAGLADRFVTHPNVVNAAALNWAPRGTAYTEGGLLDGWLEGRWDLLPRRSNIVGILLDAGLDEQARCAVENALSTFRTVGGGRCLVEETSTPLAMRLIRGPGGRSLGQLADAGPLVEAARRLVNRGAEAIAILTDMEPLATFDAAYAAGQGPDPIGGLEAMISRLVGRAVGRPTAHAPWIPPSLDQVDPRGAAEELGLSYFLCVLRGLQEAPAAVAPGSHPGGWPAAGVLVVPATAMGGSGTYAASKRGLYLVAVDNPSVLEVTAEALGLEACHARTWAEAAGVVLALREGIAPETLQRPFPRNLVPTLPVHSS